MLVTRVVPSSARNGLNDEKDEKKSRNNNNNNKKIGEYEENNMNKKIKLCWQSCRKRDEHALSKFLAGTVQLPADAEKPIFRFMVKRDWTTSPGATF